MATILVRGVAALFFSQSVYGIWWIWHYDYPRYWQIVTTICCLLQCLMAQRLWALKRWIVVCIAVLSGLATLVARFTPALRHDVGWQLYYLLMCITLTVVATQEWNQLKSGI